MTLGHEAGVRAGCQSLVGGCWWLEQGHFLEVHELLL